MDDSASDMGSDLSDYESDGASDAFEAPPVQQTEVAFNVLSPDECQALAQKEVRDVVDMLNCEESVAQLLLRHFKWDKDKLFDGMPRPRHALATLAVPAPMCLDAWNAHTLHLLLHQHSAPTLPNPRQ